MHTKPHSEAQFDDSRVQGSAQITPVHRFFIFAPDAIYVNSTVDLPQIQINTDTSVAFAVSFDRVTPKGLLACLVLQSCMLPSEKH